MPMALRRWVPLFLVVAALPVFSAETEGVPLCLRAPEPALTPAWPARTIGPDEAPSDSFFEDEVWAKVGERTCLNCHSAGGDAEESKFLLKDVSLDPSLVRVNRQAFERMAAKKVDGKSRLLVKVSGGQNHGGGVALKPESTGYPSSSASSGTSRARPIARTGRAGTTSPSRSSTECGWRRPSGSCGA